MNIELTLALIVLFFGVKFLIKVLKSGSPENAIKLAEEQLEKNKVAIQNKGAYIFAWLFSLSVSIFFIWVSLKYIYSLV